MNQLQWAYMAGVLDADGHIGISSYVDKGRKSPHYKPKLEIVGDSRMMDWLNAHVVERNIQVKHEPYVLYWRLSAKPVISNILLNTIPFLTTKKERAIIVKELCDLPRGKHLTREKFTIYQRYRAIMDAWHSSFREVKDPPTYEEVYNYDDNRGKKKR